MFIFLRGAEVKLDRHDLKHLHYLRRSHKLRKHTNIYKQARNLFVLVTLYLEMIPNLVLYIDRSKWKQILTSVSLLRLKKGGTTDTWYEHVSIIPLLFNGTRRPNLLAWFIYFYFPFLWTRLCKPLKEGLWRQEHQLQQDNIAREVSFLRTWKDSFYKG